MINDLAPFIFVTTLVLIIGGVILLRPLSKQLGALLKAMAVERGEQAPLEAHLGQIRDLLENLDSRMSLIEKKQDFTDSLLQSSASRSEPLRVESPRIGEEDAPA